MLLSLHSTGRTGQLLDILRENPHPGAVLHWFNGTPNEISEAIALGCYFSVNNAMSDDRLTQIPTDKMLPETDFPASRKITLASKPGDTRALEQRLAHRDGIPETVVRHGSTAPSVVWPPLPGSGRGCLKPSRKPSAQPGSRHARRSRVGSYRRTHARAYRMSRAARTLLHGVLHPGLAWTDATDGHP